MKEQEMGLPEGWEIKKLEDVVDILDSQRIPVNTKERELRIAGKSDNELYPYYGATGEVGKIDDYIFDEELVALGEDGVPFLEFGKNKAYMIYGKTWVNNHAHVLRAKKEISENKYIYYFLNQFDYQGYVNGGTRLKLTQGNMKKIPFILPPLPEQQHLSQKLTALLDGVAEAKQRLEKIPALLKQFRQSVLADAVSGKLINEEFIEKNTLKDCADILNGARKPISSKEREKIQGIIPYYGATGIVDYLNDFTHNGRFLLVGEDGANLLTKVKDLAYIVEGKVWVNNHAHVLKEKIGFCLDFIKISINALDLSPWVTGSAQPKLTKKALENLPIPKATFEQQTQIIQKVETYFALAYKIETEATNALEKVNLLTQSILAKAFRGELSADWRAENNIA